MKARLWRLDEPEQRIWNRDLIAALEAVRGTHRTASAISISGNRPNSDRREPEMSSETRGRVEARKSDSGNRYGYDPLAAVPVYVHQRAAASSVKTPEGRTF